MNITSIKIKAELMEGVDTLAALDRGCTLTKFIYVSSLPGPDDDNYTFQTGYCLNTHFEEALHHIKEHAILPKEGIIPVTGLGGDVHQGVIKSILKLEPKVLDEFQCHVRGAHFLYNNFPDDVFCHPKPAVDGNLCYKADWADEMMATIKAKYTVKEKFPFIFCVTGSAHVVFTIQEDGSFEISGILLPGGNTYISLCKLLLGTIDYDAVEKMAIAGSRREVDTVIGELSESNPDSPYGVYPADLPIFSFGKAFAHNKGVSDFKKEDIARSLVAFMTSNFLSFVNGVAREKGISNIYIGGNMITGESMRIEMETANVILGQGAPLLNVNCFRYAQTGCFGVMLLCAKK